MPKTPAEAEPGPHEPSLVRASLTRFMLLSLVAMVVLGVGSVLVSRHIAADEARREAKVRSRGMANGIAAPLIDSRVRAGEPEAVQRLGRVLENRMRDGSVQHILVWDERGGILWSDQPDLIGEVIALPDEVPDLFGTDDVVTGLPGEREPHEGQVESQVPVMEVYVGARDADGAPFVFEAYLPSTRIDADRNAIFVQLFPIGLGALLLFQLAVLPMAWSLARRVDRARRHRADLLGRALASWHEERRRLAQDLHDGVIQDLSAASYALPTVLDRLPEGAGGDLARHTGERINGILQQDLRALRSMVIDLFPADLGQGGLRRALEKLASRAADTGVQVLLDVPDELDVDPRVAGLVYRVVREGLRNVEKHARARVVSVRVSAGPDQVAIEVADDGDGLAMPAASEGHVGLQLLSALVVDLGGDLDLGPGDQGGVVLRVRVPALLPL